MADLPPKPVQTDKRLDTWKQIAAYLSKDVRTVIRWEKDRNLPVHRIPGEKRSSVYAWPSEIDLWLHGGTDGPSISNGSTEEAAGKEVSTAVAPPIGRSRPWGWLIALAALLLLAVAAVILGSWARPNLPHLGRSVQITSDGWQKDRLAVSGTVLFFDTFGGRPEAIARIDQNGDKRLLLPFGHQRLELQDVSPDGSEVLVVVDVQSGVGGPLWIVPTDGAPPRRLARLYAVAAAWSPTGRQLAYFVAHELYLTNSDGAEPRRLANLHFHANQLRWSPDGKRIRLSLSDHLSEPRLWDVPVDRSGARRLLPGWSSAATRDNEGDGHWTPDGRFFIFAARHGGTQDLWAIRERSGFFDWRDRGPFRLTTSPSGIGEPVLSKDGKKLFAVVVTPAHDEMMRYDPGSERFATYPDPAGLSAGHVSFSRDGKHVAYVAQPEMSLWIMNADGTGRQKLADNAALPRWSPDGRQIAYMGWNKDSRVPTKIHLISADGGTPRQAVQSPEWQGGPTWTSDGSGLIFGENDKVFPIRASCSIHLFDFKSGKTSDLPGSTGLWTARACPTGRYIAAATRDNRKLVLYDMRRANWTEMASFPDSAIGANPTWSSDGRFIYVDAPDSTDPAIYRISVPGKRMERVASLKGIQRINGDIGLWMGLTPDNLPLILRALQSSEVYAWDWIAP